MNIVELIEGAPLLGEPEDVIFGYFPPVDGRRVDDPPEVHQAIKKAGGCQEVVWADADPALVSLAGKRAACITVHTTSHTVVVGNEVDGWHILKSEPRLGRRRPSPNP